MKFVNPAKFYKPPVSYDLIARDGLYDRLEEGAKIPLTLISAPSGFGKSTLVSSWLDQEKREYCWLSLEDSENSLAVFLISLIGSIRQRYPNFGTPLQDLLNSPNKPPLGHLTSHFNRALSELSGDLLIVLDDFHMIRDAEIHRLLYEAFKFPLQHIHLLLLTRHDPPWPMLYFRSKGWLLEIRSRDLSFSRKELELFFQKRNQKNLQKEQLDHIHEVTEGWPTGVRLLSVGLKGSQLKEGYWEFASNYFNDLIDQNLLSESPLSNFCLWMSAFDDFNADFADFILSFFSDMEVAAEEVILELVRDNLFIIPMDDKEYFYRFHHLIREYLFAQLTKTVEPEKLRTLHQKAADWYIDNGHPEKALKHYNLGEEFEKAVHLFRERCKSHLSQTNWANLRMEYELFPDGLRIKMPELRLAHAWICTYEGDIFEMFRIVEDLRYEIWDLRSSTPTLKAEWAVLEAYRAYNLVQDYQSCRELCEYALTHLPSDHTYALGYAWIFLGASLQVLEGTPPAVERIQKSMQAGSDPFVISHQLMVLCYVQWMDGNIPMLQRSARELLDLGDETQNSEAIANALHFLGIAAYTTGDKPEAERILKDFFQRRYHTIAIIHFMGVAALIICRAAYMGKKILECGELKSLEDFVHGQKHPFYLLYLEAFKTELIWRTGNLERAAERSSKIKDIPLTPLSNLYCPHLTRIKALISTGLEDNLDTAESEILQVQNLLEATNNLRFRIDLDLLRAQLYFKQGNRNLEKKHLISALKAASVYQIVSPFLEMDKEGYSRLGTTCNMSFPSFYGILNPLRPFIETSEPVFLSPREEQVLALLSRHLSNKEIGNQLNISEKTVKRHASNLYKKLGVKNRSEAVTGGKELNLVS